MTNTSQNIILISFELEILDSIFTGIKNFYLETVDKEVPVDFYLDSIDAIVLGNCTEIKGVRLSVKNRNGHHKKEICYYCASHHDLASLGSYLSKIDKSTSIENLSLAYCFSYLNLYKGFGAFDYVDDERGFLKFELTCFLNQNYHIRSLNLVYFPDDEVNKKIDWLKKQPVTNDKCLSGSRFSVFFNGKDSEIEQFDKFLELPTYILTHNRFINKIPF